MPEIDVEGAKLHYSMIGRGPLLLCISGANGDCEIWQQLAYYLRTRFTVAVYDRRGFSRSLLTGPQDSSKRLETDADDAAALIQHLSPQQPATVLGSSSGAIVALALLLRHPHRIRLSIAHEPPLFRLQPGTELLCAEVAAIYDIYRADSINTAIDRFAVMTKTAEADMQRLHENFDARSGPYRHGNAVYWFENEMRQYPMAELSVEMFQPYRTKLMPINGQSTRMDAPSFRASERLANGLDLDLVLLPGAHVGYASHSAEFAEKLMEGLRKRDNFYTGL